MAIEKCELRSLVTVLAKAPAAKVKVIVHSSNLQARQAACTFKDVGFQLGPLSSALRDIRKVCACVLLMLTVEWRAASHHQFAHGCRQTKTSACSLGSLRNDQAKRSVGRM